MRTIVILLSLVALARGQPSPPGMRCPQRTLVLSEFGENAANSARFQAEHLDYMRGLMKSGKVITAGPMTDNHTTAMVFATKDWAEVEAILKKEPFHREGVLKVVKHMVWNACEVAP
ncbi:MAG TPA: YciI family protein [Bryobacteraceae bacterium]|nr:YciI family protein [Bryobacteraceae bacterium]